MDEKETADVYGFGGIIAGCRSVWLCFDRDRERGGRVPADLKLIEEETVSPNEAYVDDEADIVNYTVEVYQDDEYDIWVYASSNSAFFEPVQHEWGIRSGDHSVGCPHHVDDHDGQS